MTDYPTDRVDCPACDGTGALRERPYRFGELKALLAVSDAQMFNTLQRLRKQGLVERAGIGVYRAVENGK